MDSGFQVLDSLFLSVELGLWIPIISGFLIPLAVFPIPEARIPDITSKTFPGPFAKSSHTST